MKRWWAGLALCVCCSVLSAKPGVVHTSDGLTYEGDVTEGDNNTITVRVRGIATTLDRSKIASIAYGETLADDIESRWKKLRPTDVRGRQALGKEAFEARQYLLARKILEEVLKIDPNNREAYDLYDLSRAQLELERRRSSTTEASSAAPVTSQPVAAPALTNDRRYVSAVDINNIREMEVTSRDTNLRVRVDPDLAKRFTIGTDINPAEFRTRPPLEQFNAIRSSGRGELLKNVHILSDPQTIIEFRRDVQPAVLAGCAASHCHGSPAHSGHLQLLSEVTDPAVYTNFYNLATYAKSAVAGNGGVFGGGGVHRMIDRSLPENSLVLQYMLPADVAAFPHPVLKNGEYRGLVKGKDDPRYQRVVSWISGTLSPTEPQYNVAYRPPFVTGDPVGIPATAGVSVPGAVPETASGPAVGVTPPRQ